MKKVLFFVSIFLSVFSVNAQINTYEWESAGYFTSFTQTNFGLVFTDNYGSRLYMLKNGQVNVLAETPGCGRYFSLSPDGNTIGFKQIDIKSGLQTPMLLNLNTRKMTALYEPVNLCGQITFTSAGNPSFSVGNSVVLNINNEIQKYDISTYSNLTPISSNGNCFVFNDDNDQLHCFQTVNGIEHIFTDAQTGYVYPLWSPDGKKVAYSSIQGNLFVWDKETNQTFSLGKGGKFSWTFDSQYLLYQKNDDRNLEFNNSDIFLSKYDGSLQYNLSNTPEEFEMSPAFTDNQTIIYSSYNGRKIYSAKLNWQTKRIENIQVLLDYSSKQKIYKTYHFSQKNKAITLIPNVPYVNQKYDTPSWHNGSGSCAPTTSIMAIAYYNRLPKWPVEVDHGQSWDPHTNDYGSYVADKYRFNEIYYEYYEAAYGTDAWGGYGYMWDGSYSPSSRMKTYIENHKLVSNQIWTSSCTFDYTKAEIDNGYVHPICSYITSSGHLTLTRGYVQGQHTLIFNDPYGNKNIAYPSYNGVNAYYDWPGYNNGYQNLDADGSHGGVAWTVKAEGSEPLYNDTIIDNNYYNHGFYMSNVANGSHMRYFRDYNGGYNNHCWYTLTMANASDICWVSWTPNLPQDGNYEVSVYIPDNYATTDNALYHIYHDGGETVVPVSQIIYSNQWVSLGIYHFTQGQTGYVYLGDSTGTDGDAIAFDAVKWEKMPAEIQFTVTDVSCYGLNDGEATAFTNEGTPPYDYVWNTVPPQTTQTATNLSAGTYEVTISDASSNVFTGSVTILQPDEIINNITANNPTQAGLSDGNIFINTTGGVPSYVYVWTPNVSSTNSATGLATGTYVIETIDNNNCSRIDTVELIEPVCGAPQNLQSFNITSSSAQISWSGNSNLGYYVGINENGTIQWDYFFVSDTTYFFSGLAAATDYNFSVATICSMDTSTAITDNFTTQAITNQTTTVCHGIYTDAGGINNNYANNEDYTFTISPVNATQISITFYNFAVEANYDTLFVYDGTTVTAPLVGTYSGTFNPFTILSTGSSLTFRFKSDYATTAQGWFAEWTTYGGDCATQPSSVANLGCVWKTTDFMQNFIDNETTGLGFKDRFYDVLYLDNGYWKGNGNLGFFNDNFEQANIDSVWSASAGVWSLNSGHLFQSDELLSNTIFSTAVKQDSLHNYLYHWSMAMDGNGTNRRAGIYFFCDSSTTANRGNSYMAWYRLDNDLVQLYKVHDNGNYDLVTSDFYDFNTNTWYDFKVYFNSQTGEFTTFINDVKVSSFIDSAPYGHGNYISLRTGNAFVWYDDFKVYKSRITDEMITVGSDSTKAVRAQNPQPNIKACRVKTMVIDAYNHLSILSGNELNVDWTPPQPVSYVIDGTTTDIDTTNDPNQLSAHWDTTSDANSGLSAYYFAIGTTPGGTELLTWTNNMQDTIISASGFLSLQNNITYYFSVKAINAAGLLSLPTVSDGQHTILAPMISFDADQTILCSADSVHFQNNTEFADTYYWQFDGGSPNVSSFPEPTVFYQSPGTYGVVLIASSIGGTDTLYFPNYITIGETPVADFSATEQTIYQPLAIATFVNNSTSADSYLWDFGDGTTSTDQTPYHIYQDTGYYTVTLIAYNTVCGNDTLVKSNFIHVMNNNSISDFESQYGLTISPNPFSKVFTIQMSFDHYTNLNITLKDITGKRIQSLFAGRVKDVFLANDLALPSGVYLLQFQTDKENVIKKIIKR